MLENSYDASGIKFGVLVTAKYIPLRASRMLQYDKDSRIIDFKNIDGLTISDLRETVQIIKRDSRIVLLFYNKSELEKGFHSEPNTVVKIRQSRLEPSFIDEVKTHETEKSYWDGIQNINIKGYVIIPCSENNLNKPIDELVEEILLEEYNDYSPEQKKYANCFLQRYRYGTKERTDEVIKQKVLKKEQ